MVAISLLCDISRYKKFLENILLPATDKIMDMYVLIKVELFFIVNLTDFSIYNWHILVQDKKFPYIFLAKQQQKRGGGGLLLTHLNSYLLTFKLYLEGEKKS